MFSKFIVNSPWYFFLLSALAGFLFAGWLYYRNKKNSEAPGNILRLFFVLRFFSISIISLLLLNLFFRQLHNETENPLLLVAVDNSSSMVAGKDSAFVRKEFLKSIEELQNELGSKYKVRSLQFGSTVESYNQPGFNEKETDLDNLMREIDNNYSNQNIGALILASDGIYNKGSSPLYSSEKLGFPIYAVAMGDTSQTRDLLVQKINHNEIVYAGNNFPVEVVVGAKRFRDREIKVTLLQNGQVVGNQLLKISSDNFVGTSTFTLNAASPGVLRYQASISLLEEETNKQNNAQQFVVEVINNKEKILLLANAPHPDVSAIREALAVSGNYELDYSPASDEHKPVKAYNLVIIHGYSLQHYQLAMDCRNQGIPFWIVAPKNFENLPGLRLTGQVNRQDDAEPVLNNSFGLFTLSQDFRRLCAVLPAVKTPFGKYQLSNNSHALLQQKIGSIETENALFYFTEDQGLKTAVFAGDGLWQWKMRNFAENKDHKLFNELLSKTVQYLVVKADRSFFRVSAPRVISENQAFELSAEVYNRSYELVIEPEVSLELINFENKKFNYTFSPSNRNYVLNAGMLPAGDYRYIARVKVNNELQVKEGVLSVKEVIAEKLNQVADHRLLLQLANRSGGKLFKPADLNKLLPEILNNQSIKPVTYSQISTLAPIDLKWIFFAILLLLGIEWFLRKRYLII